jgi:hypothetical protein
MHLTLSLNTGIPHYLHFNALNQFRQMPMGGGEEF